MADKQRGISEAEMLAGLFKIYRDKLYYQAFDILHDEYQAEDAVGDAFENFIPYLDKCKNLESRKVKALLTRLVKNAAIDIYRKNKREQMNVPLEEQGWLEDPYKPTEAYLKMMEYQELIMKIKKILPESYWQVLVLRYFYGMPVREIAGNLNMAEDNVYTRLRRAREKAKMVIGDEFNE